VATSLGLVAVTTCPPCQAGTCTECTAINATNNCTWYTNSVFGGTCGNNTAAPPSPVGTYTMFNGTCPACKDSSSCATCTTDPVCAWYELPGGVDSKCREASPGFAYTKVTSGYCTNANPCAGQGTCTVCKGITVAENATYNSTPCSWYTPKSGMEVLYNPKCDLGAPGTVEGAFYDVASTCPPCSGTSCTTCKAETNCKWVAVTVATVSSFGQCLQSSTANPGGKTEVTTCPDECKIYSCTGCIANSKCTWYSASKAGLDDTCDRSSDSSTHPLTTLINGTSGTCPACKASRCFECNNEAGCGWYVNTIPGLGTAIPGTGDCAPTSASHSNEKLIPNTDSDCDGASSDASSFAPGFVGLLLAVFLYHN
jgi:hypothetical protein